MTEIIYVNEKMEVTKRRNTERKKMDFSGGMSVTINKAELCQHYGIDVWHGDDHDKHPSLKMRRGRMSARRQLNLYGKVNTKLQSIVLNPEFLDTFDSGNAAVNFVVTAFKEVKRHFQTALSLEQISLNEKFLSNIRLFHSAYIGLVIACFIFLPYSRCWISPLFTNACIPIQLILLFIQ